VAVESVTITVKVTVPLWVGVPDNVPAPDNAIPIVAGGNGPMAMVCSVAGTSGERRGAGGVTQCYLTGSR